jgi:hypothetical protein
MTRNSSFGRASGGIVMLAVVGLAAFWLTHGRPRSKAPAVSASSALPPPNGDVPQKDANGHVTLEFKALVAQAHPGMDLSDELKQLEKTPVDFMKLPLPERREHFLQTLAAYSSETWDRHWARPLEDGLNEELKSIASESVFEVRNVECRSTKCLVTVAWPNVELAQAAYAAIVGTPLGLGCRLEILPPPDHALEAQALLDCSGQREASARAVPMVATFKGAPIE